MFLNPRPNRPYCKKHGTEYSGYMCPECAQELVNRRNNQDHEFLLIVCPNCQEKIFIL